MIDRAGRHVHRFILDISTDHREKVETNSASENACYKLVNAGIDVICLSRRISMNSLNSYAAVPHFPVCS